jgi:uncharacterized repeat protein (TIGR01451 family)
LFGTSAIIGLGWLGVAWSQHHTGSQDPPLPDLMKAPVNADAASWADNQARAPSGDDRTGNMVAVSNGHHTPADPFQGISQSAADLNSPSVTATTVKEPPAARQIVGDRYANDARYSVTPASTTAQPLTNIASQERNTEPAPLNTDPAAQPIPPDPTANRNAAAESTAATDYRNTPVDYRNQSPDTPQSAPIAAGAPPIATGDGRSPMTSTQEANPFSSANSYNSNNDLSRQQSTPSSGIDPSLEQRLNPNRLAAAETPPARQAMTSDRNNFAMQPNDTAPSASNGGLRQPNSLGSQNAFPPSASANDNNAVMLAHSNAAMPNAVMGNAASNNQGFGNSTTGAAASGVPQEGFGKPGDKKLEGAQTPSVTIEKIAPPEIQVGKPAKFQIVVRNTGPVIAENVEVTDPVPQGTQLLSTNPRTATGPRGEILWKAGDLRPGENSKLEVELMPIAEGEIGSTASVQFRSAASMRTVATKPDLVLEMNAPKDVLIGQNVTLHLKISNPGSGAANNVVLSSRLPPNLQHQAGSELEFDVGQFKPGDSRELELTLHAIQAGPCTVAVSAQGDANLHTEQSANIEIVAPRLEVKLAGPGLRYLDKQAKYTVSVSNPGTAPAKDITLVARLPKGMQFVDASDSGHFDSVSNAVMWGLDELPAGQTGSVTLTALAKETGDQKLRSEIKAAGGLSDVNEQVTVVEGVAAVAFTVTSVDDPVEVGGKATYEIHVVNQGSKAASHLQLMAVLPDGMQPLSGEGPAKQAVDGQRVIFEAIPRLEPKKDLTYKVIGQCNMPGDMRIQVYLQTDDMSKPVVKEEGTKVYKD